MRRLIVSELVRPLGIVIALALLIVFGFMFLGPGIAKLARNSYANITARVTTVSSPAPVIVEQLQSLNRLETAKQVSHQVVEARSDMPALPEFLVKDKLVMMVQTEVVAGVDFSRVKKEDIYLKDGAVTIRLPEPELFSVNIDDGSSRVYGRETGWLVFHPDPDLERQARMKATSDAREAAMRSDVLTTAKSNAEASIRGLLKPLGFPKIRFEWSDMTARAGDRGV